VNGIDSLLHLLERHRGKQALMSREDLGALRRGGPCGLLERPGCLNGLAYGLLDRRRPGE
jgi:hypothetical protein